MSQHYSRDPSRARTNPSALSVITQMSGEGVAAGNGAVVDELCSRVLVAHRFGLTSTGGGGLEKDKAAIRSPHASVADLTCTIEDAVEAGDTVWVRSRARCPSSGPYGPPSERPIDITCIDIARMTNGDIVEHWSIPDRLARSGAPTRLRRSRVREVER